MTTLRTYVAPCTPMESTPLEIATPSTKDTQRKIVRGTIKKTIKKRRWQPWRQGIPKIQGDSSSNLCRGSRFQKQTSRKASVTNHHGSRTCYTKISQLVRVSDSIFKRRPMDQRRKRRPLPTGSRSNYCGMTVMKVLIDGGAGLNIIFSETLRKMGLQLTGMITPMSTPFMG